MTEGRLLFITAGSGGVGKSATARATAQALALHGDGHARVVLADANPGQQTQRAFHHLGDDVGLEKARMDENILHTLIPPRRHDPSGRAYAILPGPLDPRPDNMPRILDMLGRSLALLANRVDWIIVDMDRVDPVTIRDRHSVAGGVMLPWVDAGGAGILFKIESQLGKTEDGLEALETLHRPQSTGLMGVIPPGAPDPSLHAWKARTRGLGRMVGVEHWTEESGRLIASGRAGWPKGDEPDDIQAILRFCGINDKDRPAESEGKKGKGVMAWLNRLRHGTGNRRG